VTVIERLPVGTISNGHRLEVVVHTLRGQEDGPSLGIVACVHGDEPIGIEVVRRLLDRLADGNFRGTIHAIPVANAYGLQSLSRSTPIDMTNLNRAFPGSPDGDLTEQLAHVICERLVPQCDALIDFHSGGNLATVDYVYMHDDGPLSLAFGCEVLYESASFAGTLGGYARSAGLRVVVPEIGGGQQLNEHYVEKGVRGGLNVMKALGMLDGEPELPTRQLIVTQMAYPRPHHGGIMLANTTAARLGESVTAGYELGSIIDPATFEVLETIRAPFDENILVLVREPFTKVDPGDFAFIVGNATTARVVEGGAP
jgi:predicted deacylase